MKDREKPCESFVCSSAGACMFRRITRKCDTENCPYYRCSMCISCTRGGCREEEPDGEEAQLDRG